MNASRFYKPQFANRNVVVDNGRSEAPVLETPPGCTVTAL